MTYKTQITARFEEFGIQLFGSTRGWKKKYAEALGLTPGGLQLYLTGRNQPGNKLQEKLRDLGCDIEWLMTGKKKEELKFPDNVLVSYGADPDPEVVKRIHKLAVWMSTASKEDAKMVEEVARRILHVDDKEG